MLFMDIHGFAGDQGQAEILGGDSDTLAAITGSIAEAFYGVPGGTAARVPQTSDAGAGGDFAPVGKRALQRKNLW